MLNPRLLNSVKRMTSGRERSMLEIALAEALLALLGAECISLYKLQQSAEGSLVWLVVEAAPGDTQLYDNGLAMPENIVTIDHYPLLQECLSSGCNQIDGNKTVLPITSIDSNCYGFIEITGKPMNLSQVVASAELRAIFENVLGLLDYSETDTLTGLLNRKTFDEYLTRILLSLSLGDDTRMLSSRVPKRRRGNAPGHDHWLGVIDIDHFKRINDSYGHSIGDEILLLLATMMKASFRTYDKLFRFGGEEFVVLLKPTEDENALAAFDRFRLAIEARAFPLAGRVTVSIGFARIGPRDQPSAIFDRADAALYWAKEHGRNQVCNYEVLVAEGVLQPKTETANIEFF